MKSTDYIIIVAATIAVCRCVYWAMGGRWSSARLAGSGVLYVVVVLALLTASWFVACWALAAEAILLVLDASALASRRAGPDAVSPADH